MKNSHFRIHGGKKLRGTITPSGSKNAALPCMAAALLTRGITTLENIPDIEEISRFVEVFLSIGIKITRDGKKMTLDTTDGFDLKKIDQTAARRTRVVLYLIGIAIHSQKKFKIPLSGGCLLGARSVSAHLDALQNLGVKKIHCTDENFEITAGEIHGTEFVMYESGDTATINAIFAATLARGTTKIKMASANYMVQDICFLLCKMGAKITGIGSTTLVIDGVKKLKPVSHAVMPDPIEAMTFIAIAATTNSEIEIRDCPQQFLELELKKLEKMGWKYEITEKYLWEKAAGKKNTHTLLTIRTKKSKLKAVPEKISCRPFPGLNIDNLPFFVPIATQTDGETLIHDWPFERRMIYAVELQRMGAQIYLADPHRLFVTGKTVLKPTKIEAPQALRPSVVILICMLAADGVSELRKIYHIARGYENLPEKLRQLGAQIEIFD